MMRYNPLTMMPAARLVSVLLLLSAIACAQSAATAAPAKKTALTAEQRTAAYLESIKKDPLLLRQFLLHFPKGGDLHHHLTGAAYAENYIQWAAESGLCVNTQTLSLVQEKLAGGTCNNAKSERPASDALKDPVLYRNLIDSFSMRNFDAARGVPEYHFFNSFVKFGAVSHEHYGDMIAEVAHRAALQNEHYIEIMFGLGDGPAFEIADKTAGPTGDWTSEDFGDYRKRLLDSGMHEAVAKGKADLDAIEKRVRERLHCDDADTGKHDPGCAVTFRYIEHILRAMSRERVFTSMVWGCELAEIDPRLVAINPAQPEDWYVPMRDYELHMQMFDYLRGKYAKIHYTLHAGELGFTQVMPEELGQHIPKAIEMGHAERIGHGVDVMYAQNPQAVLKMMAQKKVAVEINLTSNDLILGVKGTQHPLRQYMKAGVPVVISTDDEGVSRTDITNEYQRAVEEQGMTYAELKRISRNSLEYSFLEPAKKAAMLKQLENNFAELERKH